MELHPPLLLLLIISLLVTVVLPYFHKGEEDTLLLASGAVKSVLTLVTRDQCSVILFTDGKISPTTLYMEFDQLVSPRGVTMFELTGGDQDGNLTQGRITRAVDYARQLRQVSWCVTAVVVSDDKDFLAAFVEVSLKGRLLVWSTRLLAVTRLPLPQLDHIHTTFSMTNSMLLVLDNLPRSLRSTVYLQLPYSPQGARMLKIAFWTPQRGLVLTSHLSLFPEKFSKFQSGASLVVVAEEYQPHAALKQGDGQGQPLSFTGPMINLLDLLAISLNFTYTFVRPPDGSWGTQQADGTWTGMVGIVKREEADIGLGPFGMSAMRAGVVDYTRPILVDYLRILGGCGRLEVDPWGFLLPLAPLVWGATMAVLLLLLVIVLMLSKYYAFDTSNLKGSSRDIYFKYLRVLLQQDTLVTAVNIWWDRVALMMWMLLMLVLSRSYCGNLMSLLAVRYIPQPYQALRLLVHSPAIMIWEASTVYVQYITSVPSGTFHDIAATRKVGRLIYQHGYEFPKSMDTVVRRGSHVIIVEDLTIKVLMAQDFSLTGRCDFYASREKFLPYVFAMIVRKNSPLARPINERIKMVTEAGLYSRWLEETIPNSTSCVNAPTRITVTSSLTLINLWGIFSVLCGGYLASVLVFLLEPFLHRLRR